MTLSSLGSIESLTITVVSVSAVVGSAGEIDTCLRQHPFGLDAKWCGAAVAVVSVVQCEQVEAVLREQSESRRLIEIEQQPERTITKSMCNRPQSPMHHFADIERR